ncbi:Hypothetical protein PHPALM_1704 [Phytophthora palmivora]|uniref:PA domain-containing protein n=1 Tax=Phytophthora palmivora TaxID=4796 RepID=A0A2P4YRN1_9STRA|nr:Hypothetical protein PHPALM_1704 [Phytophthora palmivora]
MKSPASLLLLLLSLCVAFSKAKEETTAVTEESPWGRIYLRNGLAPIQYFRDDFGGPMAPREVSFYFPKRDEDRFGCEPLPDAEQRQVEAANRSAVLVLDRGECTFERKARLADEIGAAGLVVVSATDDVSAPVAALKDEDDEISIASVMIRRTAGDMMRIVATQMTIFGRLIPMSCKRKPYTCKPRYEVEEDYIQTSPARGGSLLSAADEGDDDDIRLGSFLGATYGSVLPTKMPFRLSIPLDGSHACSDATEDMTTRTQFVGKAVLIPAGKAGKCSEFEKVSNAQRRGATVVLLVQQDNATVMTQPSVEVSWHAYNITIPVLAVSSTTGNNLANLKDTEGESASLRFAVSNGVADAWELLAKHSLRSAWPKRLKKCGRTLAKLLTQIRGLNGDYEIEEALKNIFLGVVGGSLLDWEKITHLDEGAEEANAAPASSSGEQIVHTMKKLEVRDEL